MNKNILKWLLQRKNKYWKVMLTRRENEKFWVSEWAMRKYIRTLRNNWLKLVWKAYCWEVRFTNVYEVTKELVQYIRQQLWLKRMSFDIVSFNDNWIEIVKSLLWLRYEKRNYVVSKDSEKKVTLNSERNIIAFWYKDWTTKHYNLFNWLKAIFWLDNYNLIKELI